MSKLEFMRQVEDCLRTRPEFAGVSLESHVYLRHNDTEYHGITIRRGHSPVAPTFYVDRFYEAYVQKKLTASEAAEIVWKQWVQIEAEEPGIKEPALSYEACKDRIIFRLISASRNRRYLKHVPFYPFLDLALVFSIVHDIKEDAFESIPITNDLLAMWKDVTVEMLLESARENTPRYFPPVVGSMLDVMQNMAGQEMEECFKDVRDIGMLLLSNSRYSFGATAMLYEEKVAEIAEQIGEDFYVIPSSLHEVLLLPASLVEDSRDIDALIRQVNREVLSDADYLSDRVYFYKKSEHRYYF